MCIRVPCVNGCIWAHACLKHITTAVSARALSRYRPMREREGGNCFVFQKHETYYCSFNFVVVWKLFVSWSLIYHALTWQFHWERYELPNADLKHSVCSLFLDWFEISCIVLNGCREVEFHTPGPPYLQANHECSQINLDFSVEMILSQLLPNASQFDKRSIRE